uniref:Interleukin-7 n=1 Tax=Salarias fasciatus TaxID=181472 RepID=A0A672IKP9_SALFA
MTLLCTSVLALLLLPLSLSCNSSRLPQVAENYPLLRIDLDNSRENVTTLLKNSSCPKLRLKLRSCASSNNTDFVSILFKLTCRMKHLKLPQLDRVITSVLNSIRCSCPEDSTEGRITTKLKKRMTARRRRANKERRNQRETKELCRAEAMMAVMTECFEILNAQRAAGR